MALTEKVSSFIPLFSEPPITSDGTNDVAETLVPPGSCSSPDSGVDMLSPEPGIFVETHFYPEPSYDVSVEFLDDWDSDTESLVGVIQHSEYVSRENCENLVNEWKETNTFFICDFEERVKFGLWREKRTMEGKNILFLCKEAADERGGYTQADLTKMKKFSSAVGPFDGNNNNENETNKCRDKCGSKSNTSKVNWRHSSPDLDSLDVSTLDTSLPEIDWDAIEEHLEATREEERKRRTDRDEIRRRLALAGDIDDTETGKKPSLQSRLQNGMNLQICFVNDTALESDSDSSEDTFGAESMPDQSSGWNEENFVSGTQSPSSLPPMNHQRQPLPTMYDDLEFFQKQARLQHNAQAALSKVKEMSRLQVEIDRQRRRYSSVTEMLKGNLEKAGIFIPSDKRRFHRQMLTEMNVPQLQVIVNELHSKIETLNESLVKMLMERDELHMEQDAMLVDIEDLTKYFRYAKQTRIRDRTDFENGPMSLQQPSFVRTSSRTRSLRSLVGK